MENTMAIRLLVLAALFSLAVGIDYCAMPACQDKHIACNNKGDFNPECPKGVREVSIEPHKKMILTLFNDLRNKIAGGLSEGYPKAVRMAKMLWCDELAYLATFNTKTCISQNDKCRSTERFVYAGQNVAIFSYSGNESEYSDAEIIKEQIENWFGEQKNTNADVINNLPEELPNPNIAKFTIAVSEKNTHVGCAAVRFSRDFYNHFLLTCNFATSNIVGKPVYTSGEKAAIGCKNRFGAAFDYPNLCYAKEIYDNDKVVAEIKYLK